MGKDSRVTDGKDSKESDDYMCQDEFVAHLTGEEFYYGWWCIDDHDCTHNRESEGLWRDAEPILKDVSTTKHIDCAFDARPHTLTVATAWRNLDG